MSEPVVFVPGMLADARLFLPQMVALGAAHAVQVLLPTAGDTVELMSEAALDVLPPRFALVGQGLGGDVALDILRRAGERVSRVALISTDTLTETPADAAAREARLVAARAGRLAEAIAQEYPATCLADTEWRDDVLALLQDMGLTLGEGPYMRQSRALQRRPDQQKTMRRVKTPALVIAGRRDSLLPLRRQEFTAGLMPFGKLAIIEDAGHFPTLEQPDAVSQALTAFLAGPVLLR